MLVITLFSKEHTVIKKIKLSDITCITFCENGDITYWTEQNSLVTINHETFCYAGVFHV